MASIDERIVEMKFNRDDFLKGTSDTLGALERLEGALTGSGGIGQGVQQIGSRMTAMGAIGLGAMMKIGGAAVAAGGKIVKGIMDPLFGGGKKRALNLEQANFQLEGILKDGDKVKAVMENVNTAVDGTAYGLDAAAVVAAQFAASGMEAGQEMENALRGISGVAAMAGSSYEDVGSIFTKVAGQGRLMGDDLNRLATRGINAAATLADYFNETGKMAGATEADIREMVTKGTISFDDFAEAMNATFGDHATKANETYSGSLANIKSAIARIGAPAFTIEHEKMRRVFNALRPAINKFQKSLGPLYDTYERLYAIPMAQTFERWGAYLENINWEPLVHGMSQVLVIGSTLKQVAGSWLKPIVDAFSVIFSGGGGGGKMEAISKFLDSFNRGLGGLAATEGQANAVQGAFEKVFGAIKKVADFIGPAFSLAAQGVSFLWDIIMVGVGWVVAGFELLKPAIMAAFEYLFGQEGKISNFWEGFKAEVEKTGSVLETLGSYFMNFYRSYVEPFVQGIKNIKDAFKSLGTEGFDVFKEKLSSALTPLEGIWSWVKNIFTSLKTLLASVMSPFTWLKDQLSRVGSWISNAFTAIVDAVSGADFGDWGGALGPIGDALKGAGKRIGDFLSTVSAEDLLGFAKSIMALVTAFRILQTLKTLDATIGSIGGMFFELGEALRNFSMFPAETKSDKVLKIAIALGVLAGALWVLAQIPSDRLWEGMAALGVVAAGILAFSFILEKISVENIAATGTGLLLIALALGGFVAALIVLGMLPMDVLEQGLEAVIWLLVALTAATAVMGTYAEGMIQTGIGIMAIAMALTVLLIPITILGTMDYEALYQGMTAVIVLLLALAVVGVALGEGGASMALGAVGMMAIAAALTLILIPVTVLGSMDLATLGQGLLAIIVLLAAMAGAAALMTGLMTGALGLLAVSGAMIGVAIAIRMLAGVDPKGLGIALAGLAVGLGIMVGAAALATAVLPGFAGLAGVLLAFAVAAIAVGIAAVLFAVGLAIVIPLIPQLVDGLKQFAQAMPELITAAPGLMILGISLGIFAIGAGLAGIAAIALGIGLTLLGVGMMLMTTFAPAGSAALLEFIAAIDPLIWKAPKLLTIAATLATLGAAMIVLGAGLLLAGAGGILLGIGAAAAGVGLAILILLAAAVSPLIDRVVQEFSKLGPLAAPIANFTVAATNAAVALAVFAAAAGAATSLISQLTLTLMQLMVAFSMLGPAAMAASGATTAAIKMMVSAIATAAGAIPSHTSRIVQAFLLLAAGIRGTAPAIVGAVRAMILAVVAALTVGTAQIRAAFLRIAAAFTLARTQIAAQTGPMRSATMQVVQAISTALLVGAALITAAVGRMMMALARLPIAIRQNGNLAVSAARSLGSSVAGAVRSGYGSVYSAAVYVGSAVGAGMAAGIRSKIGAVAAVARTMAVASIVSAKAALATASPSKRFIEIANWAVDGFLIPFRSRVGEAENVSEDMAKTTLDAFNEIVSGLDMSDLDIDFAPTITPVLDLDGVRGQARGLNGLLGGSMTTDYGRSAANGIALMEEALRGVTVKANDEDKGGRTLIQNNYSPKALSEAEIYRQTKNLISQEERKAM